MQSPIQEETRHRLLNAAGEIFSEKGYQKSTIREICAKAQANLAAVNYHFGGKKGLYEALLEHCHQEGLRRHPPESEMFADAPEQALYVFILSFLKRTLGRDTPAWSTKLMAREMADPSPALTRLVSASVRPNLDRLMHIIARIMGRDAASEDVRRCSLSVVGQCQHYYRCRAAIESLFPDMTWDASGIEKLAGHILSFSLAAIRNYRAPTGETSPGACMDNP